MFASGGVFVVAPHGATFSNSAIPGKASTTHSQKNISHPIASTSHPALELMTVRGTAARLVKRASWVAV